MAIGIPRRHGSMAAREKQQKFMRAVQLVNIGQPLEMRQIKRPDIGASDLLIRVKAAGICHSDAHYRSGRSSVRSRPLTLGHEVAGIIEQIGHDVSAFHPGERVCLHYLATCGTCQACRGGFEQFCPGAEMIGKHRDGGYAEFIRIPAASAVRLPDQVPFDEGAIMMCSSATVLHAFKKARLQKGESVAIFGAGGLGFSAIQLARIMGAAQIFVVDIRSSKLELARRFGATPIDAAHNDPVDELQRLTQGKGVDVALEVIGLPLTMRQAVRSLGVFGRAALVGITEKEFPVAPYQELINKEAEIIGISDHLIEDLPPLLEFAQRGQLNLKELISSRLPLDPTAINQALDQLEHFGEAVRSVVIP